MQDIVRNGQAATISVVTGTTCPCMTSVDSSRPSYSAEWHRINPAAAACNGTGLISRTTTTVNIKAYFFPINASGNMVPMVAMKLAEIGELDEKDLMMFGPVNTADNTFYSLSSLYDRKDVITYQSKTYLVRHYFPLTIGETICELALLKRVS